MPITGSQKALMQARSGIARSGATRSDYYRPFPIVIINDTTRTGKTVHETIEIENLLEQPNTARLRVFDFTPAAGQKIVISSGQANNRVFGGTILRANQVSVRGNVKTIYDL